jgi:integrase
MSRTPLPGSVFQRSSDQRWVAQIRRFDAATGKTRVIRRYSASERGAKELLRQLRTGAEEESRRQVRPGMTVAAWLDYWAANSLPVSGLKQTTIDMYLGTVNHPLKPSLGEVLLDKFTPTEAERWLQRLSRTPRKQRPRKPAAGSAPTPKPAHVQLSVARQRTAFNVLAKALDVAVRDSLIDSNPLHRVARPTAPQAIVPVADPQLVDDVLLPALAGWGLGALVYFVAMTGCRMGEALGLRWEDVDLTARTATLRRSGHGMDSTKGGHARAVPLLPELADVLVEHRRQQRELRLRLGAGWPNTGLVFTSAVGTPLDSSNCRSRLRSKLLELDMPAARPFHSLRHGLAARLLRRDVPLPVVSALLGHSSIRVTADVYGHVQPAMHADQLAAAMGRAR